jgi:ATP-dependent exoDNAse (exonuclease V) alpha subunit
MEVREDLKDSKIRCEALMVHVLKLNESQSGNSLLHGNVLYKYIQSEYKNEDIDVLLSMVKEVAMDSELIHYNDKTSNLTLMSTYIGECKVANFVKEKLRTNKKLNIDHTKYTKIKDGTLTEEQSNILKTICDNNIAIINAKGGTGKTSVLCATVEMFEDNNLSYLLLSPTGRVANRIKEQTNGKFAQTIHKACLTCGDSGLWVDAIFVEEFSMVSLELMCMLINSISNPNCRIYFNGHLGQIAPIGVGCPMRDMIDSGIVPTCSLSKVFRYGEGGLYKMATDADDGKFYIGQLDYKNKDRISIGANKDYTYVRYDGTVEQVIYEYTRFIKRGIKPDDIAIITPWNVTDFGCINLSNKVQELVNPSVKEVDFVEKKIRDFKVLFKVKDLIMNTKNCYSVLTLDSYEAMKKDKRLTKDDVYTVGCMNGEIGRIIDIDNGNIIAKFNEDLLVFDRPLQNNLLLAYSCTSYKLQGSECPYTITLITPQFKNALNKNLIYTDMSRARKEVVEIIDPNTLAERIIIDATQERKTNLKELILDEQ